MSFSSIGDMRQHFLSVRNNTNLRDNLGTLVQELSTGKSSDLTAHLGVGQTALASVDRKLGLADRFIQSNSETGQMLSTMQTALDHIESHRSISSNALLTIGQASSEAQVQDAAQIALSGLSATVESLNTRFAGRTLFGGNDFDTNPLASADEIIANLTALTSGMNNATDVKDAVEAWFETPGGGFETVAYQGSTDGHIDRNMDDGQRIRIDVRADDSAMRSAMKSFAIGALAGESSISLSNVDRQSLQGQAGVDLLTVSSSLVSVQARLGYAESRVEAASVRVHSEKSSLSIARNNMVSVDPFETATKLEQVQLQLETHYALTARLSRLSLTEYLR